VGSAATPGQGAGLVLVKTRADTAPPRYVLPRPQGPQSEPWLGFVPDEVSSAPLVAIGRLADRLNIPTTELAGYGDRTRTRTDHLREVVRYSGWRPVGVPEWKELDEFLFARAMEHDSPKLLFGLACEYLLSERVVRPGQDACALHDTADKTWRHMDFFQHKAFLHARLPRVRCPEHGVRQVEVS
jgi:hypothetical protein